MSLSPRSPGGRSMARDQRGWPLGEASDELVSPPLAPSRPFSEVVDDELEALRRTLTENLAMQLQQCDVAMNHFKERLRRLDRSHGPQMHQDAGLVLPCDEAEGFDSIRSQGGGSWKIRSPVASERADRIRSPVASERADRQSRYLSSASPAGTQRSGRIRRGSDSDLGELEARVTAYRQGSRFSAERAPGTYMLHTNPNFKTVRLNPFARIMAKALDRFMTWEEPPRRSCLANVLKHPVFQLFAVLVIFANILEVIDHTNANMEQGTVEITETMIIADIVFLTFYTVEVLLRLKVHGIHFFFNGEWRWHLFDVFLVITGFTDFIVGVFIDKSRGTDVKFLRVSRFLRVSKVLRTFRLLSWCRELGLVLRLVQSAGTTMLSITAVLLAGMVVMSLICVQALTTHIYVDGQDLSPEYVAAATRTFGTVQKGVLTLFQCVTGGTPWEDIYVILEDSGPLQAFAMIAYILFYQFIVFNIVTSVFVEKARAFSQVDQDEQLFHRRQRDESLVDELSTRLFAAAKRLRAMHKKKAEFEEKEFGGEDASKMKKSFGQGGKVMQQEFESILGEPDIADFFAENSLSTQEAVLLYDIVESHTGSEDGLSIVSLAEGCVKSKGFATSIDLLTVMFEVQALTVMHKHSLGDLDSKMSMLCRVVAAGLSNTSLGSQPPLHGGPGASFSRTGRSAWASASATSSTTAAGIGSSTAFMTSGAMTPTREGVDPKMCRPSVSEASSVTASFTGLPAISPTRAANKPQIHKDPFDRHVEKHVQRPHIEV